MPSGSRRSLHTVSRASPMAGREPEESLTPPSQRRSIRSSAGKELEPSKSARGPDYIGVNITALVLRNPESIKIIPKKVGKEIALDKDEHGDREVLVNCKCHIGIWKTNGSDVIWSGTKQCTVQRRPGGRFYHFPRLEIKLSEEFKISGRKLLGLDESGKIQYTEGCYRMEMKIVPDDAANGLWPPMPVQRYEIPRKPIQEEIDLDGGILARKANLPELSEPGSLLTVLYNKEGNILNTNYGLEVHMKWKHSKRFLERAHGARAGLHDTPTMAIKTVNSVNTIKTLADSAGLRGDEHAENQSRCGRVQINYLFDSAQSDTLQGLKFEDTAQWVRTDFSCPLCQDRTDLGSLKHLSQHLLSNTHWNFAFTNVFELAGPAAELPTHLDLIACFTVSIRDEYMSGKEAGKFTDIARVYKAVRSCSLDQAKARDGAKTPPKDQVEPCLVFDAVNTDASSVQLKKATIKRLQTKHCPTLVAPEQVSDMPHRKRTHLSVPIAPAGVTFYRAVSKRALATGEMLSESDDDVSVSWLKQRHHQGIDTAPLTSAEKEFWKVFDDHMMEERPHCAYLHDSLIRFCRKNQQFLRREDMNREFNKSALNLLMRHLVEEVTIWGCKNAIWG